MAIQEAKPEKNINVSFKRASNFKKNFKENDCLLIISVGQNVHEGNIFLSTIKLIDSAFRECTILIDDSIQRHTLAIDDDAPPEILYKKSIKNGDEWIERNEKYYSKLTIPYHIIRWDYWLKHPEYPEQRFKVNHLYETDACIKEAFHAAIRKFLTRYQARTQHSEFNYERAFHLCLDYLQEECAAMCLWAKTGYAFEVYPSGRNQAMSAIYTHLIEPYTTMLRSISLYIRTQKDTLIA